ncbi:MAG: molybdopterin-dependent oxidoreductase [Planctomycetales bacterium]|nr:molybdopterin-dependent oxidoreductase [Planctomycetales bacterium]
MLRLEGELDRPLAVTSSDLAGLDAKYQLDVNQVDPKRHGAAVRLAGLLELVGVRPNARFLTVHADADDFHASVPLPPLLERAVLIYRLAGGPLPVSRGGPFRLLIPDCAACQTDEIDECANVKFVDRIELSAEKGLDNRPHNEAEHEALHRR